MAKKIRRSPFAVPTIQVWAANENARKTLTHPTQKQLRFRDDINQPISWPYDQFTMRRISDGDILTEAPKPEPAVSASSVTDEA